VKRKLIRSGAFVHAVQSTPSVAGETRRGNFSVTTRTACP